MVEHICRHMIGREERILSLGRDYFSLQDLLDIKSRVIGTGFIGVTSVELNGTSASFTVDSDSVITAGVPDSSTTGPIVVVNAAASDTSAADFVVI